MENGRFVVFGTQAYLYLKETICAAGDFEHGDVECRLFPDGERYLRILSPVEGRNVVMVGGTISDSDTLELYDLSCELVMCGARSLTLVVPYFGYSTMERAVKPGEVVTAKARARLLSSIPTAGWGDRILLFDLHTEGIPHYFEGGFRPVHVYSKPITLQVARKLGGEDFVLACTDAGRAKWVESLANDLGVMASFVFKRRLDGARTRITAVSAQVRDKRVVIYDDMIRTGSSLIEAAKAYQDAGAQEIYAIATHGLFPGDALERILETGLFKKVVCTDSHPRALELRGHGLSVESCAGPLVTALLGTTSGGGK